MSLSSGFHPQTTVRLSGPTRISEGVAMFGHSESHFLVSATFMVEYAHNSLQVSSTGLSPLSVV